MNEDEMYVAAYVGKGYEKFKNQKFSIFSFLFGSLYWAYRKLILEAVILTVISTLISFLQLKYIAPISLILSLCIGIGCWVVQGFIFPKIYLKIVEKRVKKIHEDITKNDQEIQLECQKKGGTSVLILILFIFISGAVNSKVMMGLSSMTGFDSDFGTDNSSVIYYYDDADNDSDEFDVVSSADITSDESVNINDWIKIEFPDDFNQKYGTEENEYELCYQYMEDGITSYDINVAIAKNFDLKYNGVTISKYSDFEKNKVEQKKIAGQNWYLFKIKLIDDIYCYATEYKNKIIFIEWCSSNESDKSKGEKYLKEILDSVELLDGSSTTSKKGGEFDISNYIEVEIPEVFEVKEKTENSVSYELDEDANFELTIYDDYEEATEYVDKIIEDNEIEDTRYDVEFEDITWNILGAQIDNGIYYYTVAKLKDKTLVYMYNTNLSAEDVEKANSYFEEILVSIAPNKNSSSVTEKNKSSKNVEDEDEEDDAEWDW